MKTSLQILFDDYAELRQQNKKLKETVRFLEKELDKERAVNRGVTARWPDKRALTTIDPRTSGKYSENVRGGMAAELRGY